MHPKDPISDPEKMYIIYPWKCPAHNYTAEYIGQANRSLNKRFSDTRNQTTSVIRNQKKKQPTIHIAIKDPSSNRNISKVRTPLVFNTLLKPHTQLKQPHSYNPHQGTTFFTWSFNAKEN